MVDSRRVYCGSSTELKISNRIIFLYMTFQAFIKIFKTKLYLYPNMLTLIVFSFFTLQSIAQDKLKVNYKHLTYLPKNYNTDTSKYPLVIYLHGGSQKGNDLEKLKIYGLPF